MGAVDDALANMSPEQRDAWTKLYGKPPPPPQPAPAPAPNLAPGDPGWSLMGNGPAPAPAFPRPGQFTAGPAGGMNFPPPGGASTTPPAPAPLTPQPSRVLPAAVAKKMNADWDATKRDVKQVEQDNERKANLEGATFADSGGGMADYRPGPMVKVSDGGRTPASWTTQTQQGLTVSDETRDAANTAEGAKMDAAMWGRRAGEAEAEREIGYLERHEKYQQARRNILETRAETQRQQYEGELGKLRQMQRAADENKIDPKEITPSISSAIGALLGGIGQGLAWAGGNKSAGNPGLDTLNKRIQEQIDAQKAKVARDRGRLEDQRSLLGQMARTFGDERQAEAAAWDAYLGVAETRLRQQMAESKIDSVRARYKAAIGDIQQERFRRTAQWDEATQDKVQRVQHDVNAPPVYAGGAPAVGKGDREDIHKISEGMEKGGIPAAIASLRAIDRSIDTFQKEHGDGEIPGVGPIASKIPDVVAKGVYGDRAVAARQSFQALKLNLQHEVAGASLTEGEKAELDKLTVGAGDAASLRRVVQMFREKVSLRARNIAASGSDTARAEYRRRLDAAEREGNPMVAPTDKPTSPYVREAK